MSQDSTGTMANQIAEGGKALTEVIKAGESTAGPAWPYIVLLVGVVLVAGFAFYMMVSMVIRMIRDDRDRVDKERKEVSDRLFNHMDGDIKRKEDHIRDIINRKT